MNTVEIYKTGNILEVVLGRNFNLRVKNMIENRLGPDIDTLIFEMKHCLLIDSEGVIFMYKWHNSGGKLKLNNPPDILFEIVSILELDTDWISNYKKIST